MSARQTAPRATFATSSDSSIPALKASTSVRPACPASITTSSACFGPRPPGVAGSRLPRLPATCTMSALRRLAGTPKALRNAAAAPTRQHHPRAW